jgi:hypothetical protein
MGLGEYCILVFSADAWTFLTFTLSLTDDVSEVRWSANYQSLCSAGGGQAAGLRLRARLSLRWKALLTSGPTRPSVKSWSTSIVPATVILLVWVTFSLEPQLERKALDQGRRSMNHWIKLTVSLQSTEHLLGVKRIIQKVKRVGR